MTPDWIARERTALLLIDMQQDFGAADGAMAKAGADVGPAQVAMRQAEALADAARTAGVLVVFVQLITFPGEETTIQRETRQRRGKEEAALCVDGTLGATFIGPRPLAGEILVSKSRFSAFAQTGLAEMLHDEGVDTLVLAGLTTECCIQSSAWDALERDFHVMIAADACAAYDPALHDGALKALELSGAVIAPTADFAACWKIKV